MHDYLQLFHDKKLVLIMSLPHNDPALSQAAFRAGADAVKVHINVEHRASGTHFGRLAEEKPAFDVMLSQASGPMGLVLGGSPEGVAADAAEAAVLPFAFHSVYAHHLPARLIGCGTPLMAACDGSYTPEEIAQMPACGADVLEASVIPGTEYGSPLCMRDLLTYRRIAASVPVPVVVPTQRRILPEDVPALVRCRVRGLMIGAVVTGKREDSIVQAVTAFRRAIDAL